MARRHHRTCAPQSVTDSAGRTTTIAYDASGAYPSGVTAPATNGVSHSTGSTYDDASGVLVSTSDENGGTTSYVYDAMSRAKTVTSPAGTTTYNYSDVSASNPLPSYTSSQSIDGVRSLTQQVNLDGLGRSVTSTLTSNPEGPTSTDTSYDALGRVQTTSNPHYPSSVSFAGAHTTDGTTTYSYDMLGRTIGVTLPDGNTQSWNYIGNVSTKTDELGSQWQQTTNGLGQLTQVMEPDPTTGKPAYETDYSYDLLGNLVHSDQWGGAHGNAGDRIRSFTYDGISRLLTATLPESGKTTYSYSAYGSNGSLCSGSSSNVCSKTDARGAVTAYNYDELGRIIGTNYPNAGSTTPNSTFTYDTPKSGWSFPNESFQSGQAVAQNNLKGRLSWETNANATIVYGYDSAGRTTIKSVCTLVNCAVGDHYDMQAAYDNLGDVTFSDLGRDALLNNATPNAGYYYGGLTLAYSTAGRLTSGTTDIVDATHPAPIVSMSQYNPLGSPGSTTFGAVLNVNKVYTPRGWMSDQTASVPVSNLTRTDHFDYYKNGTNMDLVDSLVGTTNYAFDKLSRLTSYTNPYAGVTYGYDPWANMTSHTQTAGNGYTFNLQIDANNHIANLGYDPSGAGTLTSDGLNNYSYDAEQRLLQVNGGMVYLYDPEGKRVAKQANGAVQEQYLYSPDGTLTTTLGPDSKLIRGSQYGAGEHLADYTAGTGAGGGQTEMRLMDSLGTLFVKVDQTGKPIETCGQGAYGESLGCSPGLDYTETHFTDKLRDQESSLDYSGARYYNSVLGRFTIPDFSDGSDPIPYADLSNPQSLNLYTYAANNPLGNSDLDGHAPCGGNDADSQPEGAQNPCDPKVTAPTEYVHVHATVDDSLNLAQVSQSIGSGFQAVADYVTAPRTPGCVGAYTGAGLGAGSLLGGLAGVAGGPFAPVTVPSGAFFGSGLGAVGGTITGLSACRTGSGGSSSGDGSGSSSRLTNSQQRQTAKYLGLKEVKGIRSQGQSVFEKNGRYFSFSNTSHNAGEVFKEVDKIGNRIATTDLNFNRIGP